MKKGTVAHQIIGSFEDLGKSILEETAKVPMDLAKSAFSGGGEPVADSGEGLAQDKHTDAKPLDPNSAVAKLEKIPEAEIKKTIARAALAELSGKPGKTEEISVYDEKNREEALKKQQKSIEMEQAAAASLPGTGSKLKAGDVYAARSKQTSTEKKFMGTE